MFGVRDVEVLREIVQRQGFRAAAESLGTSQSAVSNRIAALERRLGVMLFDRTRRRAVLTPQGRGFLEEAERLVVLRDRIAARYGGASKVSGTLRVGVAETIVHTRLPAMLGALRAELPSLRIELVVESSPVLGERLVADAIDVAVLMRPFVPPLATLRDAGRFDMGWYAADELACADRVFEREALREHALVTFARGSLPYREVERLFARPGVNPPIIHGCASLAALRALVNDGAGFGTLPRALVGSDDPLTEIRVARELRLSPLEFATCWLTELDPDIAAVLGRLPELTPHRKRPVQNRSALSTSQSVTQTTPM